MRVRVIVLSMLFLLGQNLPSNAMIIHEFLADPAAGLAGDANVDGVADSNDDEFVELWNDSSVALDISGWYLSDASRTRHVFVGGAVVPANGLFVVFGGGAPLLSTSNWQIASTKTLSLNNTGDAISLFDDEGNLVDRVVYGALAGKDEALVRSPEASAGEWILHSALPNAKGARFSPGILVSAPQNPAVVPEMATALLFGLGFLARLKP